MNVPAVSVILQAYNCEKFIGKAIQSVLQQTLTDFEFIIINDGSTDNTESIIHEFNDHRIVYLKNSKNEGLVSTLNKAIANANGKYIARMDADDICLPED
jgi:glycosyltransferase involved in cell wall biosynthesis